MFVTRRQKIDEPFIVEIEFVALLAESDWKCSIYRGSKKIFGISPRWWSTARRDSWTIHSIPGHCNISPPIVFFLLQIMLDKLISSPSPSSLNYSSGQSGTEMQLSSPSSAWWATLLDRKLRCDASNRSFNINPWTECFFNSLFPHKFKIMSNLFQLNYQPYGWQAKLEHIRGVLISRKSTNDTSATQSHIGFFSNAGSMIFLNGHHRRDFYHTFRYFSIQLDAGRSRPISHLTDGNELSRLLNSVVLFFGIENWRTSQKNINVLYWLRLIMLDVCCQILSILLSSAAFFVLTNSLLLLAHC